MSDLPYESVSVCFVDDGEGSGIICLRSEVGSAFHSIMGDNPNENYKAGDLLPFVSKKWDNVPRDFWEAIEPSLRDYSGQYDIRGIQEGGRRSRT